MNIFFAKILQGLNIVVDILIPVGGSDFNGIVNVYRLYTADMQPRRTNLFL